MTVNLIAIMFQPYRSRGLPEDLHHVTQLHPQHQDNHERGPDSGREGGDGHQGRHRNHQMLRVHYGDNTDEAGEASVWMVLQMQMSSMH